MKKLIPFVFLFCICLNASAQFRLNYGFGFNLNWELNWKHGYMNGFRAGVSGGCGVYIGKNFMPYLQYTQNFYQGGLGSSLSTKERYKIIVESLLATGLVTGYGRDNPNHIAKPIYTMGLFTPTPLYTDYDAMFLNLSTTTVFRLNKSEQSFTQRVGGVSVGLTRYVDAHYYNDGAFFIGDIGLGDNKDRFWTGGGFMSVYFKNHNDGDISRKNIIRTKENIAINNAFARRIVLGFDRFTGYNNEAFEVAKELKLNFVPYKDIKQAYYNSGRLFGGLELSKFPGAIVVFSLNNTDRTDVQNLIHQQRGQTYHGTLHKPTYSLNFYYTGNPINFPKP